jgi:very-short-patch-repair endonuclease
VANKFTRTPEHTRRARALRQSASKTEQKVWLLLGRKQMGVSFRRQHPAGPYFLDYYCPSLKLAIEVDGDWHDPEYDARRDAFLAERGIRVLRIPVSWIDESLEAVGDHIRLEIELIRKSRG